MGAHVSCVREWKRHPYGRGVRLFVERDHCTILFSGKSGFIYHGVYLPLLSSGSANQRQEVSTYIWGRREVKKKDRPKMAGGLVHASPDLLKGHYPKLAEWLTAGTYDDGTRREAPTLTVWASGGQWKLTLKDRAESLVMWLSAEKLLELLTMAESFCQEEDGPWRVDDYSPQHGKRKKSL